MATATDDRRAVLLRDDDNVAVAARAIPTGFALRVGGRCFEVRESIAPGHKVAVMDVEAGAPVRKYGQIIGFASRAIARGAWVHVHNLTADLFDRDYAHATESAPPLPRVEPRTFPGYLRPDGRVGTRNYVAVISAVNCSASTSRTVAERFRGEEWRRDFPNVDGVFAITHKGGCGMPTRGPDHIQLERVLAGFANHPNVAACVLVGLGCEVSQAREIVEVHDLIATSRDGVRKRPRVINIQEQGGINKTVEAVVGAVRDVLPEADACRRTDQPASKIHLAMEVRRLGRQLGRHGQPRARVRGRPGRRPGRHGRPGRDLRDLWRRAPPDPSRDHPRGRREAGRADQVVGVVRRDLRGRAEQQPLAGQ